MYKIHLKLGFKKSFFSGNRKKLTIIWPIRDLIKGRVEQLIRDYSQMSLI
jgi:hypothetical protein